MIRRKLLHVALGMVLVGLFSCGENRKSVTLEDAPWGHSYAGYFSGLVKRGVLIQPPGDSLFYKQVLGQDTLCLAVNPFDLKCDKLLQVKMFFGDCDHSGTYAYWYKRRNSKDQGVFSSSLKNSCIEGLTSKWGSAQLIKHPSLYGIFGVPNVSDNLTDTTIQFIQWDSPNFTVHGYSEFLFQYKGFDDAIKAIKDSLKLGMKPEDVIYMESNDSPTFRLTQDGNYELKVMLRNLYKRDPVIDAAITDVQFDVVFMDRFENAIFTVHNVQYKLSQKLSGGGSGLIVKLNLETVGLLIEKGTDYFTGIKELAHMKNVNPPLIKVTAVRFDDGSVVKGK